LVEGLPASKRHRRFPVLRLPTRALRRWALLATVLVAGGMALQNAHGRDDRPAASSAVLPGRPSTKAGGTSTGRVSPGPAAGTTSQRALSLTAAWVIDRQTPTPRTPNTLFVTVGGLGWVEVTHCPPDASPRMPQRRRAARIIVTRRVTASPHQEYRIVAGARTSHNARLLARTATRAVRRGLTASTAAPRQRS
jgi:hypothetical protein